MAKVKLVEGTGIIGTSVELSSAACEAIAKLKDKVIEVTNKRLGDDEPSLDEAIRKGFRYNLSSEEQVEFLTVAVKLMELFSPEEREGESLLRALEPERKEKKKA
jgi:hypothetical protein